MNPTTRLSRFFVILAFLSAVIALAACSDNPADTGVIVVPATASALDGSALYNSEGCSNMACHGPLGGGDGGNPRTVINNWLPGTWTFSTLQAYIDTNMPKFAAGTCVGQCAADTAAHISCAFNATITTDC